MFQKPAQNAADVNVLADAGRLGTQAAGAAHDQIDVHSRLRGLIEQLDDRAVLQRVHLQNHPAPAALALDVDLPLNHLLHALAQIERRHQ